MKLWVLSDLHMEIADLEYPFSPPEDADVCVVAGDLTNESPSRGVDFLGEMIDIPTIYVAGNHEFYNGSIKDGYAEAVEASRGYDHIHFLENGSIDLGGVRFLGCTLWTDFRLMGPRSDAMNYARLFMNDYRAILQDEHSYVGFSPECALALHEKSAAFLLNELEIEKDGPTVVVTHHAPHPRSVHQKYKGQLLNGAFCSDLSTLIDTFEPNLWIHGHTHSSFDYMAGKTRIVCNPRGYGKENSDFDMGLIIDI